MTLTKIKIGNLITDFNIKNTDNIDYPFYGINIDKDFMPSAASTDSVDRSKYKIVKKGVFVFSGMQTGRDCCIRIAMYEKDDIVLVSPAYTTFTVTSPAILPEYLFMYFRSNEKDRYGAFLSDGSIRSNLDWDVFCDIEIELPSIEIQRKYVEIYKGIIENQAAYETGLEDLKLVCDSYIEELRRKYPCEKIGNYIELKREKNVGGKISDVYGVSNTLQFVTASSTVDRSNLFGYKIVEFEDMAYVPTTHMKIWAAAISDKVNPFVVSPIYEVFRVINKNQLSPQYLFMWLCRSETIRYAYYNSWGSARENFVFDDLCSISIPIPNIEIQHDIVDIYKVYCQRKQKTNKEYLPCTYQRGG